MLPLRPGDGVQPVKDKNQAMLWMLGAYAWAAGAAFWIWLGVTFSLPAPFFTGLGCALALWYNIAQYNRETDDEQE